MLQQSAGPPANEFAGRVGARAGEDRRSGKRSTKNATVGNSPISGAEAIAISNLSAWLDLVEIRATAGKAGRTERAIASAIAQLIAPGATALFMPIPALACRAGVSPEAARAAIGRMVRLGLLTFEAGNGRGIASVMAPLSKGGEHGRL